MKHKYLCANVTPLILFQSLTAVSSESARIYPDYKSHGYLPNRLSVMQSMMHSEHISEAPIASTSSRQLTVEKRGLIALLSPILGVPPITTRLVLSI